MPSIEIVCVDQTEPTSFLNAPFAVESESKLVSHRSPSPLFQPDFDVLRGCIYHLGNPSSRDPTFTGYYTAYKLLTGDAESCVWNIVYFKIEFVPFIKMFLAQLLQNSPVGKVIFTSDYQFGPNEKRYKRVITLDMFWQLHDKNKLKLNALYQLKQ